jgi:hypothetical protein
LKTAEMSLVPPIEVLGQVIFLSNLSSYWETFESCLASLFLLV